MSNQSSGSVMLTDMHKSLGWLFGLGAVFALLGIAGLYFKLEFTETSMRYGGALLLIAGVIQCIDVYKTEKWLTKFWRSLAVVVYVSEGLVMVVFPDQSSSLVTMLVGMILLVVGGFRIIVALQARQHMKLWIAVVISGIVSICLGGMLISRWPWQPLEVVGTFVSIELILQGLAMLYMGFVAWSRGKEPPPAGQ